RSSAGANGRPCTWSQWRCVSRIHPSNGRPPSVDPMACKPVPASSTSAGPPAPAPVLVPALTAMHEVCPPTSANSGPETGVEPRTPRSCSLTPTSSLAGRLFASVALAHRPQHVGVDLIGLGDRDARLRDRPERGSTPSVLDDRALAEDRARSDLAEGFAVDLD